MAAMAMAEPGQCQEPRIFLLSPTWVLLPEHCCLNIFCCSLRSLAGNWIWSGKAGTWTQTGRWHCRWQFHAWYQSWVKYLAFNVDKKLWTCLLCIPESVMNLAVLTLGLQAWRFHSHFIKHAFFFVHVLQLLAAPCPGPEGVGGGNDCSTCVI